MTDTKIEKLLIAKPRIRRYLDTEGINKDVETKIKKLKEQKKKCLSENDSDEAKDAWHHEKSKEWITFKLLVNELEQVKSALKKKGLTQHDADTLDKRRESAEVSLDKFVRETKTESFLYLKSRDELTKQRIRFNKNIPIFVSNVVQAIIEENFAFGISVAKRQCSESIRSVNFVEEGHTDLRLYPLYCNLDVYKNEVKRLESCKKNNGFTAKQEQKEVSQRNGFTYYISKIWSSIKEKEVAKSAEFKIKLGKNPTAYLNRLIIEFLGRLLPWISGFIKLMRLRTVQDQVIENIIRMILVDGGRSESDLAVLCGRTYKDSSDESKDATKTTKKSPKKKV